MTDSASDTYKKITTLSYLLSNSEFGERVREIIDARNREMTKNIEAGKRKAISKMNCKPVSIDGIIYESTNAAMKATGRSHPYCKARRL